MRKNSFSFTEKVVGVPLLIIALWILVGGGTTVYRWSSFQNGIINASKAADVETLATKYAITRDEAKERIDFVRRTNPELTIEEFNPSQAEVDKSTREEIEIFVRSYADLWNSKYVASFEKPLKLADSYSVVLWFEKDDAYHGVVIQNVVKTKNGLKVNDWNGWRPNSASVKRAELHETKRGSLRFPEKIE